MKLLLILTVVSFSVWAQGPPGNFRGQDGGQATGPLTNRVSNTIEGDFRIIRSSGIPDHAPGQFPRKGNPNRLAMQNYTYRIPLKPAVAARTTSSDGWSFGVALNGVPFESGTAEFWGSWKYEALSGAIDLGMDDFLAHVQPGGQYHYHGLAPALSKRLGDAGQKMVLLGYAADGFPIYTTWGYSDVNNTNSPLRKMRSSYKVKAGERPAGQNNPTGKYDGTFTQDYEFVKGSGDLDECNGRFGPTPEFPAGTYHYYVTTEFPQFSRLFKGTPDRSFGKGGPGGGPGGPGGPGGFGPPGGGGKRKGGPGFPKGPPPQE
jgi:hypothetical protein